jgi:hypothetical protein
LLNLGFIRHIADGARIGQMQNVDVKVLHEIRRAIDGAIRAGDVIALIARQEDFVVIEDLIKIGIIAILLLRFAGAGGIRKIGRAIHLAIGIVGGAIEAGIDFVGIKVGIGFIAAEGRKHEVVGDGEKENQSRDDDEQTIDKIGKDPFIVAGGFDVFVHRTKSRRKEKALPYRITKW